MLAIPMVSGERHKVAAEGAGTRMNQRQVSA
jgi:hypothetical protein